MATGELAIRDLDFEASAHLDGAATLRLTGSADGTIVDKLTSLVDDLHALVMSAKAPYVDIDIRELEFMNASCFNVLVSWVGRINDLAPDERYELRFATNNAIPWQRRSLRTLSCFATDLVKVET